ncbi:MAG TPA: hypothetical protein VFB62_17020, partial [Polyangiaceae bacterium]|nr:hypothetical protein [Polyangiaceae bacterium]
MIRSVMGCALLAFFATPARAELPPTDISYRIEVSIDPASRRYSGHEVLRWKNRADRPIDAVPMHLYLNAFANRASTWMRESFLRGIEWDEFLRQYDDPWGWVEPTAIRQRTPRGERALSWRAIQPDDENALDRTLIEVRLANAVEPAEWLEIVIEFAARMPVPIARTGCVPDFCLVAQWFPKIAVLDTGRWAAHQFHGPTEFYADFADYDVTIDAPSGWLVRATGKSQPPRDPAPDGVQRVRHVQRAVHDFAIVLGSDLVESVDAHRPKGGGPEVEVHYLLPSRAAATDTLLPRARYAVEGTLDILGSEVGPYPYDVLTVVTPPYRGRRT